MADVPHHWLPPDWRGRRRIEHPVNWARLPEFDVGVCLVQLKTDYGHLNTWLLYFRDLATGQIVAAPTRAQQVITSSPGSTQTITSDVSFNSASNSIEVIGGGASGAHGASTTTSGGGGGGGAYKKIINAPIATPGTTQYFVRVGAGGGATDGTSGGDSWWTLTTPGTSFPVSGTAVGAKAGTIASATTATGGPGGSDASSYASPATGAVGNNGGTGGAAGASATAGGGGGGAGGASGVGGTPGTGPSNGGTGNGGLNGGGTAGTAGNPGTNGGNGTNLGGTTGSGGGGGGGNASAATGGDGGNYGGGGGGGARSTGNAGAGIQGVVVVSWDLPFDQFDWPVPKKKETYEHRTFLNASEIQLIGQDAFFGVAGNPKYDWPNPRGPQPPASLYSFTQTKTQELVFIPCMATVWLNPIAAVPRMQGLGTWTQSGNALTTINYLPAGPVGWFNPWGPLPRPPSFLTWAQPPLALTVAPFGQTSWPNPIGAVPSISLRTWTGSFQTTGDAKPFLNDWVNPPLGRRPHALTWTQSGLALGGTVVTAPFQNFDQPNPRGPVFPTSLLTWIGQMPPAVTYVPSIATTWANPEGPVYPTALRSWSQSPRVPTPVVGPKPFAQTDWPNPIVPRAALDLRTWITPAITEVSYVLRGPTITPIRAAPYPTVLLTWTSTFRPTGGVVQAPFNQFQWPNPRGAVNAASLLTWINRGISIPPFNQTDWPNPQSPRRSVTLLTSTQTFQGAGAKPFNQTDWPNPGRGARPTVSLLTWTQFGGSQPTPSSVPFLVLHWPVPKGPIYPVSLRTWTARLEDNNPIPIPFNQFAWPNPRGPIASIDLRSWLETPPVITPAPIPFNQADWPVPRGVIASINRTWTQRFQTPGGDQPAPNRDWPNPQGARRPVTLLTSAVTPQATPPAVPFVQTDWPNPQRALPRAADWVRGFSDQIRAITPALNQDWPNPGRAQYPLTLRTWTQGPNPAAAQKPFAQTDWPLPRGAQPPIALRTAIGVTPPISAIPVRSAEWPNPRAARQTDKTWIDPTRFWLKDRFFGTAGPVYDYPNPRAPGRSISLLTWTNSTVHAFAGDTPFIQSEWPVPKGAVPATSLLTWVDHPRVPFDPNAVRARSIVEAAICVSTELGAGITVKTQVAPGLASQSEIS